MEKKVRLSNNDLIMCEKIVRNILMRCGVDTELDGNTLHFNDIFNYLEPFSTLGLYKEQRISIDKYLQTGIRNPWQLSGIDWRMTLSNCGILILPAEMLEHFWDGIGERLGHPRGSLRDFIWTEFGCLPLMQDVHFWVGSKWHEAYMKRPRTIYNNPDNDQIARDFYTHDFGNETGARIRKKYRKIPLPEWRTLLRTVLDEYRLQCQVITSIAAAWLNARQKPANGYVDPPVGYIAERASDPEGQPPKGRDTEGGNTQAKQATHAGKNNRTGWNPEMRKTATYWRKNKSIKPKGVIEELESEEGWTYSKKEKEKLANRISKKLGNLRAGKK